MDPYRMGYRPSRPMDSDIVHDATKDVAFNRRSFGMEGTNHSPLDKGEINIGTDNIHVHLFQGIQEQMLARFLKAAEDATTGVDLTPQDHSVDLFYEEGATPDKTNEMFKGGLQTALESQVIVFAVSGVSRTATHQLVRTRKAAFHQQSQRASWMGIVPNVRIPESIWVAPETVKSAWIEAIRSSHHAYDLAVSADVSYQDARFILPEGTETYILLEYPIREFLNVYAYRACYMFQWEISHVMRQCREVLITLHPWIEPYVKISCEKTKGSLDGGDQGRMEAEMVGSEAHDHHCTFQGWEEVEHQCPFAWARESNRAFRSEKRVIKRQS